MKFGIKNLGAIKEADIAIGDLTIICGKNNCGKTYLTYALYAFLASIQNALVFENSDNSFDICYKEGSCVINAEEIWKRFSQILDDAATDFGKSGLQFLLAFGAQQIKENLSVSVKLEEADFKIFVEKNIEAKFQVTEKCSFHISKQKNSSDINILIENTGARLPKRDNLRKFFNLVLSLSFNKIFPDAFSLTGERSGISIFADNVADFSRRADSLMATSPKLKKHFIQTTNHDDPQFPLPVIKEFAFFQNIKRIRKRVSYLVTEQPDIIQFADMLAGGRFDFDDYSGIQYFPENSSQSLSLSETSSSVKSLVEFNFYLRHCAKRQQILMIDEPELNLHPGNQRKIAQLLVRLVNAGIRVFITTHSDYIIRELNTLIMLKQAKPHLKRIMEKEGYSDKDLLDASRIKAYVAQKKEDGVTFESAPVLQEDGIVVSSLDEVIDKMNQIQDAIIWGAE